MSLTHTEDSEATLGVTRPCASSLSTRANRNMCARQHFSSVAGASPSPFMKLMTTDCRAAFVDAPVLHAGRGVGERDVEREEHGMARWVGRSISVSVECMREIGEKMASSGLDVMQTVFAPLLPSVE